MKIGMFDESHPIELDERLFFSTSAKSCNEHLKNYLDNVYSVKTVWEK